MGPGPVGGMPTLGGWQKETYPMHEPVAVEPLNQSKWNFWCSYTKLWVRDYNDLKQ